MKLSRLLIAIAVSAFAGGVHAESESSIKNNTGRMIRVYWKALGCAGVKDGRNFVCSWKDAEIGGTVRYSYRVGTSNRRISILDFGCDHNESKEWDAHNSNRALPSCKVH